MRLNEIAQPDTTDDGEFDNRNPVFDYKIELDYASHAYSKHDAWVAALDNYCGAPDAGHLSWCGKGSTPAEAIIDLQHHVHDHYCEQYTDAAIDKVFKAAITRAKKSEAEKNAGK